MIRINLLDVLLVDDDQNGCNMFGLAIDRTDLNIRLRAVTDGEKAIDYLEGRGVFTDRKLHPLPNLVVLDLDMRLAAGLLFLGWHRASASFSSLPVVMLSAFAYKGAIEMALALGANTLLPTAFELEDWEAMVRRIWDLGMEWCGARKPALAVNCSEGRLQRVG